jgi:hypothetical protein
MTKNINQVIRQTYRYFYEDGLVEMALGLLFVVVGLLLFVWQATTTSSVAAVLLAIGLPLLVIGGALLFRRVIRQLKERITFPRTGYVAYRQDKRDSGRWVMMGAAVALMIAVVFLPDSFNRMQFMVGSLLGAVLIYMGYRVSVWRFYVTGVLAVALGLGLTLLEMEEVLAIAFLFVASGLILLVTGAVSLMVYLRRHPQEQDLSLSEGS